MFGLRLTFAASFCSLAFFCTLASGQTTPELLPGKPVAREIGDDIHDYLIKADGPRLIHVVGVQKGVDIRFRLMGPDGKHVVDSNWYEGTEDLWHKLEIAGTYTLKVKANQKGKKGGYEVRIAEMIDPATGDPIKIKAIESTVQALALAEIGVSGPVVATRPASIPKFKDAIAAYLSLNDADNAAKLVIRVHFMFWEQTKHQEQIDYFDSLLKTDLGSGNNPFRGQLLTRNGFAFYNLKKPETADELYEKAMAVWKQLRDDEMIFTTLMYRGENWRYKGDTDAALRYLGEAARHGESVPKPNLLLMHEMYRVRGLLYQANGHAKHFRGGLYASRADFAQAIENYEKALELSFNDHSRLLMYVSLADLHGMLADYDRAVEATHKAFAIIETGKTSKANLKILWRLRGVWASNQGDLNAALEYYQKALSAFDIAAFAPDEQSSLEILPGLYQNIGSVHMEKGDYARAMEYFRLALDRTKETDGELPGRLLTVGNLHSRQGNIEAARDYYRQALAVNEKLGGKEQHFPAVTGLLLGATYVNAGEYEPALKYLNDSLEIFQKLDDKHYIAEALVLTGGAYEKHGKYDEALARLNAGLERRKALPDRLAVAITQHYISGIHLKKNEFQKALALAESASAEFQRQGALDLYWRSFVVKGVAYAGLKEPSKARASHEAAITVLEKVRGQIAGGEVAQTEFKPSTRPYLEVAALLAEEGKSSEALIFVQRAKSRALLDILQHGRIDVTKALTAEEKQKERQLKNDLFSLNKMLTDAKALSSPHAEYLKELTTKIEKKRREFDDFQFGIYAAHPELKIQRGDLKPISLEETARLLPDRRSAVVEYLVGDDRTLLLVVTRDSSNKPAARFFTIDTKEKQLEEKVEAFRSKLAAGDLDFSASSRELYDILLKPAEKILAGVTDVVIAPDAILWAVPFQALQNGRNKFVAESTSISLTPSLTALAEMKKKVRRTATENELLAFGNPIVGKDTTERVQRVFMSEKLEPLPEAERLVNELARMYGPQRSKALVGNEASEDIAKREASKYRIVQFATHGILNNSSPMYSHLVLARGEDKSNEDGLLEAWELKDLDLNADMVILSACDTARGKVTGGEGVIGMTWAAFIAGAPTTVASQWKVESSSTTEFMLEFHRQMLAKKKVSKAEAMRRASLKLMKSSKYRHPLYWAPWVLVGDGS